MNLITTIKYVQKQWYIWNQKIFYHVILKLGKIFLKKNRYICVFDSYFKPKNLISENENHIINIDKKLFQFIGKNIIEIKAICYHHFYIYWEQYMR